MWVRSIIGGLLCIAGVIWIGQGAGLVHGSFMTGELQWALIGAVALLVGVGLLSRARRSRHKAEESG